MSKYGVWAWQQGEGCDYMIGCGSMLVELDATTLSEAIDEARDKLIEHGCTVGSERELREAHVVEFKHEINILNDLVDEEEEATAARRAQYEKLKQEFGDD